MSVAELLPITDVSSVACCSPLSKEAISATDAEAVARTFKALGDPARVRILSIVASHVDQEACVCDLQEPLDLSQPTVSHHLKILMDAGFLTRSKRGTWAYYALVPGSLDSVAGVLTSV
jgi:ArsR family transcriptional regulator, arsenate/arsenite/antimonite-responsive transcriptional repressor